MSTPGEDGHPRSGAGIDPDRPAIHGQRPPAVPSLAAGVIRRRPAGARPPLPQNLREQVKFAVLEIKSEPLGHESPEAFDFGGGRCHDHETAS